MTDHDTQETEGCSKCPYENHDYGECEHPSLAPDNAGITPYADDEQPPLWCPLRTRPVLVRLVAKEKQVTTAKALFDFTIQTQDSIEQALYFRARMGHRGLLEVPEPTVSFSDDGVCTVSRQPFVWHETMPTKTTHGGKASFFDLTDESVIAAALKAKESR